MKKNVLLYLILLPTICAGTLLAAYYFLVLTPKKALPDRLLQSKNQIIDLHSNLVQNRLAVMELTKLDFLSSDLADEKEQILGTALDTNTKGTETLNSLQPPKPSRFTPGFLNDKLYPAYPALLEKNKDILTNQKHTLEKLEKLDNYLKNIYLYNPIADIGTEDKEAKIERSYAAVEGLGNIINNLGNEYSSLSQEIQRTQNLFKTYAENIEDSNSKANNTYDQILESFLNLRKIALEEEISLIHTDEFIKVLTDQTNLILEYEFWVDRITNEQIRISKLMAEN